MFDLNLQYVHLADRERRIEADLRRRQILKAMDEAVAPETPLHASTRDPRRTVRRPVRATGR
jgi:hypothetical protein